MTLLEWPRVWGVRILRWRSLQALRHAQRHLAASYRAEDDATRLLDEAHTIAHRRLALAVHIRRTASDVPHPRG